jgi:hypothetical protein
LFFSFPFFCRLAKAASASWASKLEMQFEPSALFRSAPELTSQPVVNVCSAKEEEEEEVVVVVVVVEEGSGEAHEHPKLAEICSTPNNDRTTY